MAFRSCSAAIQRLPVKTVLLTGASGVLGQALQQRLAHLTLFCPVRRTPVSGANVVAVPSDVSRLRLGLTRSDYAALTRRIQLVIHAAAVTDFRQPEDVIAQTNVEGTKNVLDFAAAANVPIYYVGTAFCENQGANGAHPTNAYEQSKRAAEAVVRSSGIPSVILRPSIIMGDSATGAIGRFQGFHFILSLFLRGFLPLLPFGTGTLQSYVDFVPQDLVARVIAALVERGDCSGDYWLTAGDRAPTVKRIIEIGVEHGPRLVGRAVHQPRVVAADVFERLIRPVFFPALPATQRHLFDRALQLSRYFNIERPFPSSLPRLARELNMGPLPCPELTLVRNLEYWAVRNEAARLATTMKRGRRSAAHA